jgi:hypothetical protein
MLLRLLLGCFIAVIMSLSSLVRGMLGETKGMKFETFCKVGSHAI